MNVKCYFSTDGKYLEAGSVKPAEGSPLLRLTGRKKQEFLGFGGCFSELGWDALQKAEKGERESFLDQLFLPENCGFNYGRVPIGANDFSLEWYSCDETDGDLELKHFNIERDKKYTIPFVKEAMKRAGDKFFLFASPWSPPTWMKTRRVYNFGFMRMEPEILKAYAQYFVRFIKAYEAEGVRVAQICPQNEPMADQKFPSCKWSGDDMRLFISDYLGPAMEEAGVDAELWLGTINGPFSDFNMKGYGGGAADGHPLGEFYDRWSNNILSDEKASRYISGVGLQWGGKHLLELIDRSWQDKRIMATESECNDGANCWNDAQYIFRQLWMYLNHRAERVCYWNIALTDDPGSTWGWGQNSLCIVKDGKVIYTPEFYVYKHFAAFVKPGARVLETEGCFFGNTVAFENPDGGIVLVVGSNMNRERKFVFEHGGESFSAVIPAESVCTFVIN